MSNTSLPKLADFYVADMQRWGCSPDAMTTNRRALQRFARFLAPKGEEIRLAIITPERANGYLFQACLSPKPRNTRWTS